MKSRRDRASYGRNASNVRSDDQRRPFSSKRVTAGGADGAYRPKTVEWRVPRGKASKGLLSGRAPSPPRREGVIDARQIPASRPPQALPKNCEIGVGFAAVPLALAKPSASHFSSTPVPASLDSDAQAAPTASA